MTKHMLIAAVIGGFVFASAGHAQTITGSNGFGTIGSGFSSCKDVSASGSFVTGTLASASDWSGGCVGFYQVDLNTSTKTITLTGLQVGNYESAFLDISGITGMVITGLTQVGPNNLFDPTAYGGAFATDVPTPTLSYTGNSLHFEWTSIGSSSGQFAFSNGGSTVFNYASAAPEPAAWAMMVIGFGFVGVALRRRSRTSVKFAF